MEAIEPQGTSKRGPLIRGLVTIGILVVIFGVIFPGLVDFDLVWEAIKSLDVSDIAKILAGTVVLWICQGWVFAAARPGLGLWRGTLAWLGSTCWANLIPIPFDIAVRFGMYRYWRFTVEEFGISTALSGFWTLFIKLGLPAVAVLARLAAGQENPGWLVALAVIGAVVLVVAVVLLVGIIRSQGFAEAVGRIGSSIINKVLGWIKRPPVEGVGDRVLDLRANASDTIRSRWLLLSVADAAVVAANVVLLTMCLRAVGVSAEVLGWTDVLTGYAIVLLVTVIPLTPGGVGIAELAYIAVFSQLADTSATDMSEDLLEATITAGVFVYRIVTWLLVIPVGFALQALWRWRVRRTTGEDPIKVAVSGRPAATG